MDKTIELLKKALQALNDIPRRKLSVPGYKDSYELAAAISDHLKKIRKHEPDQ